MKLIYLVYGNYFCFFIRSKNPEEASICARNSEATSEKEMKENVWYRSE